MPVMNGYVACTQLKNSIEQGKLKDIFIVAYTADYTELNNEVCKEAKFDRVYHKPIKKEDLKALIQEIIN